MYRDKLNDHAKTESSEDYVALPFRLSQELEDWRKTTRYAADRDFIFPNSRGEFITKDNFLNRVLYPVRDALGHDQAELPTPAPHLRHQGIRQRQGKPERRAEAPAPLQARHQPGALHQIIPESVFKMVDAMYDDIMAEPKRIQ